MGERRPVARRRYARRQRSQARWWADPVAALLMVPWLVKEGIEGLRAEEHDDSCCG